MADKSADEKLDILLCKINEMQTKIDILENTSTKMAAHMWILDRLGVVMNRVNPFSYLTSGNTTPAIED